MPQGAMRSIASRRRVQKTTVPVPCLRNVLRRRFAAPQNEVFEMRSEDRKSCAKEQLSA
jgi:hypothetical protein